MSGANSTVRFGYGSYKLIMRCRSFDYVQHLVCRLVQVCLVKSLAQEPKSEENMGLNNESGKMGLATHESR